MAESMCKKTRGDASLRACARRQGKPLVPKRVSSDKENCKQ